MRTKDRRTKNRAGSMIMRSIQKIDRMHAEIDRRRKEGKDDAVISDCKLTKDGARVWSF